MEVDLSDNAFGPDCIKMFECLLKEDKNLKVLKITNCGLGPEGGEMIANALASNEGLKLREFYAGRDRLENKGITALAHVFSEMGSLQVVHVPQNGIKDAGMRELIAALQKSKDLHTLRVNDNWLKAESTEQLLGLMLACRSLRELNISDGNMGTANVLAVLRALRKSTQTALQVFSCNYNDVESRQAACECLEVLLAIEGLQHCDFVGNVQQRKWNKEWIAKFTEAGKTLKVFEEGESDDEAAGSDEEEDEPSDDEGYSTQLSELCEKLD